MKPELPKNISNLLVGDTLTDIFINGVGNVWSLHSDGQIHQLRSPFETEEQLAECAMQLAACDSKRLDLANPFADISLPGGIRAHAVLASGCSSQTLISIRVHRQQAKRIDDLISDGFMTQSEARFLRQLIADRKSFIISGATGAGKTTLLRSLLTECLQERVVILEDTPELAIDSERWVALRTRESNIEGRGAVDLRALTIEALRMKPDRIVLGEVRSNEIVPLLQALNTGHGGSATTLHSNSIADVSNRLLAIGKSAGLDSWVLSELVASAVSHVIQVEQVDGRRKIQAIGQFSKSKQGWLSVLPIELAPALQLVPDLQNPLVKFA
jgi:pilus assembly protein CpaF